MHAGHDRDQNGEGDTNVDQAEQTA